MKKYREYMDNVRASDTLHQRLAELKEPGERPGAWKKYGFIAAALALALGLGGYGVHYYDTMVDPRGEAFLEATLAFDPVAHPDIALTEPGDVTEPGEKTLEGYAVEEERGGVPVVCYYMLPYIDYGGMKPSAASQVPAADWDIPQGAVKRDLAREEIIALMGGEDAVATHLDWGGYELTGWAAWYEDGSFWGAYIMGHAGELDHFEFSVTADQMPPTCVVYSEGVTQEIRGLTVIAEGHDSAAGPGGGVDASTRRVSFMKDDYGYRFDLTGASCALTEQRVSRLVCHVADRGLELSVVGGAIPEFVPDYDPTYEDGVPEQDTSANDPRSYAYNEPWVCPDCGAHVPAGEGHTCELCQLPLAPDTHTCEVCGQALPAGVEHSHGVICPDCGESYAEGTAHTCRQEGHHQEGHHGGHH